MTKIHYRADMQRTRFINKFLKNPTEENKLLYSKQGNFDVSLLKKENKEYFAKINENDITNNRKTVKLFFWIKSNLKNLLF